MAFVIETRTSEGWHRLHTDTYPSLIEATYGLERYIDEMYFIHKVVLPTNIFRLTKPRKRDIVEATS
jgi:hypothetical protein